MLKNELGIKVYNQNTRNYFTNFIQHYKLAKGIDYSRFIGNGGDNGFIFFGIDLIKKYNYEK